MPLSAVVDALDGVPETLRDEYEQRADGKFALKVLKGYEPPEAIGGLKSALQKERERAANEERQRKQLEERFAGVDPDRIQQLLDAERQREEETAKKAGEFDKLRQQMVEQHTRELGKRDEQAKRLQSRLERQLIDAEATRTLADQKGNVTLLMPHIKARTKVVERDGDYAVVVVDEQGNPRVNAKGEPLTINELVGEMRTSDVFASAFAASGNSGTGGAGEPKGKTPEGEGNGGGKPPANAGGLVRSKMTAAEKATYMAEHGSEAYLKLPYA